jgi:hypothetical protein
MHKHKFVTQPTPPLLAPAGHPTTQVPSVAPTALVLEDAFNQGSMQGFVRWTRLEASIVLIPVSSNCMAIERIARVSHADRIIARAQHAI